MSLERADVEKIAHLARLAVSEAELDGVARDLSNILALVEQMNAVDTRGVAPSARSSSLWRLSRRRGSIWSPR